MRENGLRFELSFTEGYSVGLFLDQRDNRRRFLVNHVSADFRCSMIHPGGGSEHLRLHVRILSLCRDSRRPHHQP